MHASERCGSDMSAQLHRGARERVHMEALCLGDCPPRRAESGLSRPGGEGRGGDVVGFDVYITQNGGRGAMGPTSTLKVFSPGRVSKSVTASLAAVSARSFPRMWVCALIFRRTVE